MWPLEQACAACDNSALEPFFSARSHHLPQQQYQILRCPHCGHCQAVGPNDGATLRAIYSGAFFATSAQSDEAHSPIVQNAQRRAARLAARYQPTQALDVGAGIGIFVKALSSYCVSEGVEYSSSTAEQAKARGLTFYSGDFLQFNASKQYDLITFWDVLACFETQQAVLQKAGSALRDNGRIVLTVPMNDSFAAKCLGRFWPFWIPPVNQHFYSRRGLAEMAKRSGLRITASHFYGKTLALDFIVLKLLRSMGIEPKPSFIQRIPAIRLPVNTFDILEVHLEKNDK